MSVSCVVRGYKDGEELTERKQECGDSNRDDGVCEHDERAENAESVCAEGLEIEVPYEHSIL